MKHREVVAAICCEDCQEAIETECQKCEEPWPCKAVRKTTRFKLEQITERTEELEKRVQTLQDELTRERQGKEQLRRDHAFLYGAVAPMLRDLLENANVGQLEVPSSGRTEAVDALMGLGRNFNRSTRATAITYTASDGNVYVDGRRTTADTVDEARDKLRRP